LTTSTPPTGALGTVAGKALTGCGHQLVTVGRTAGDIRAGPERVARVFAQVSNLDAVASAAGDVLYKRVADRGLSVRLPRQARRGRLAAMTAGQGLGAIVTLAGSPALVDYRQRLAVGRHPSRVRFARRVVVEHVVSVTSPDAVWPRAGGIEEIKMLRRMADMPAGTIGFEAIGDVGDDDFEEVVAPVLRGHIADGSKVRLLYLLGPELREYDGDAVQEEMKFAARHATAYERVAVVSDESWLRPALRMLSVLVPGQLRAFPVAELGAAKRWVATGGEQRVQAGAS
jgi:hypothetical protein